MPDNRVASPSHFANSPEDVSIADKGIASAWNASGQLTTRFEIARAIGSNAAGLFKPPEGPERPAFPQIASAFYFNTVQQTLSAATRSALDQARSPQEWNALFLSSPEFMR